MKNYLYFLLLLLTFISCKKEEAELEPIKSQTADRFDISNSKGLAILQIADELKLFKLSITDEFLPVKVLDIDGKPLRDSNYKRYIFDHIYNIDENYVLISGSFKFSTLSNVKRKLLVDLRTGKFYDANNAIYKPFVDEHNNMFYNSGMQISKCNYTDPNNLKDEDFVFYDSYQNTFVVDKGGNVLYSRDSKWTYKTFDHIDINIQSTSQKIIHLCWLGKDGLIRYFIEDNSTREYSLYKLSNENGNFLREKIMDVAYNTSDNNTRFYGVQSDSHVIEIGSKVYIISKNSDSKNYIVDESQQKISFLELPNLHSERELTYSEDFVYIADGTLLYKIAANQTYYSSIYEDYQYKMINMGVTTENELYFSALRYSDGKNIFAKLDESNQLTILDDSEVFNETLIEYININ